MLLCACGQHNSLHPWLFLHILSGKSNEFESRIFWRLCLPFSRPALLDEIDAEISSVGPSTLCGEVESSVG